MAAPYEIVLTGNHRGYVKCPVCGNKLEFEFIRDSFEHNQPYDDIPQYVLTKHEIQLSELNCWICNTHMNEMILTPSETHKVDLKFKSEQLKHQ